MKKLRHNIRLLALMLALLFIGLGAYFSYSVYFYGGRWFASANNPRLNDQKQNVITGDIMDRNGLVLATTAADGKRAYPRHTGMRQAVSHVVGDSRGIVANGVETFMAGYLLGFNSGILDRAERLFSGQPARGDDVRLTIDAELCEYAASLLKRYQGGAIVVLNWKTGEVLCSTSYPDFDPRDINATMNSGADNGALVNRATQGLYPPGSTFKIITMASALDNIIGVADREAECTGTLVVDRTTVTEASGQVHGRVTMQQAFARSCNTVFASLSLELGYNRLSQTASSFGFGDNFLFRDMVVYNAQYPTTNQNKDDLAWSGVGQGRVLATPLHMAMIAGAIANDGVMMEPRLMLSVTTAKGGSRTLLPSRTYKRACAAAVAQTIKNYMIATVVSGTGSQARMDGVTVAGKTGSAEASDDKSINTHAWFVGFADSAEHPLAIAVVVERGGAGSSVAAPIARNVLNRAVTLGY
ncbi:MAG: penicillin-binding transpeptidase domain-containing protein [Firmicutes bacterium]|nr:penicillin-binding transpeptidase domain-containing protein [Bacillota bacterium]